MQGYVLIPLYVALVMFASMLVGVLAGNFVRPYLPEHHVSRRSKSAIRLTAGLIVTLSALVISLMVSSAKSSFDSERRELNQISSCIVLIDKTLAQYGPETRPMRELLRIQVERRIHTVWPETGIPEPDEVNGGAPTSYDDLQKPLTELEPKTGSQRLLQAQAISLNQQMAQARWFLLAEKEESSVPRPFLVVLGFWLLFVFAAFSFQSPWNPTVVLAYFFSALAVACAVFLILELESPYTGIIRLSSAPMLEALSRLGQ